MRASVEQCCSVGFTKGVRDRQAWQQARHPVGHPARRADGRAHGPHRSADVAALREDKPAARLAERRDDGLRGPRAARARLSRAIPRPRRTRYGVPLARSAETVPPEGARSAQAAPPRASKPVSRALPSAPAQTACPRQPQNALHHTYKRGLGICACACGFL